VWTEEQTFRNDKKASKKLLLAANVLTNRSTTILLRGCRFDVFSRAICFLTNNFAIKTISRHLIQAMADDQRFIGYVSKYDVILSCPRFCK
jgi:hypothetical protein